MISVGHPRRENAAVAAFTWRSVSLMRRSSLNAGMMTETFKRSRGTVYQPARIVAADVRRLILALASEES
jgi:hypothetical protein